MIDKMPTADGTPLWQWRNKLQETFSKPTPAPVAPTPAPNAEPIQIESPVAKMPSPEQPNVGLQGVRRPAEVQQPAEPSPQAQAPQPGKGVVPFKQAELPPNPTAQDVIELRQKRIEEEIRMYREMIGLSQEQAETLQSLMQRDADTEKFFKKLTPEQAKKADWYFEQSPFNQRSGPFKTWEFDSRYNPEELIGETDKAYIARSLASVLERLKDNNPESDRFTYAVIAARRLAELGATQKDLALAADKYSTAISGSQGDKAEMFKSAADKMGQFMRTFGIELPTGEKPTPTRQAVAPPAEGVKATPAQGMTGKLITEHMAEIGPIQHRLNKIDIEQRRLFAEHKVAYDRAVDLQERIPSIQTPEFSALENERLALRRKLTPLLDKEREAQSAEATRRGNELSPEEAPPAPVKAVPPPAVKPSGMALQIEDSKNLTAVKDFGEASGIVDKLRQHALMQGEGASGFPRVYVVDLSTGKRVAKVAYNGRVFDMAGKEIDDPTALLGSPPAETPAARGEGGLKQVWEMTRDEFFDEATKGSKPARTKNETGYIVRGSYASKPTLNWWDTGRTTPPAGAERTTYGKFAEEKHRLIIKDALLAGKPVPAEVLADYPDLDSRQPTPAQGGVETPKSSTQLTPEGAAPAPAAVAVEAATPPVAVPTLLPKRTSPRQGTPEREKLNKELAKATGDSYAAYSKAQDLKDARDKAAYGTKKREQLDQKMDKANEVYFALKDAGEAARKRHHQIQIEDLAEAGVPISSP